jgi:hypothetical protein
MQVKVIEMANLEYLISIPPCASQAFSILFSLKYIEDI